MLTKNLVLLCCTFSVTLAPCMTLAMQNPPREKCPVCLEKLSKKPSRTITLECKHQLHPECIWQWAHENRTCMLCRKPSTLCIYPQHIAPIDEETIKDIMKMQTYRICNFKELPARDIKKILILAGGLVYPAEHEQSETITINATSPQQQENHQDTRADNILLKKKIDAMARIRAIFVVSIFVSLVFILPEKMSDLFFLQKLIMLAISACGLYLTFCYPENL